MQQWFLWLLIGESALSAANTVLLLLLLRQVKGPMSIKQNTMNSDDSSHDDNDQSATVQPATIIEEGNRLIPHTLPQLKTHILKFQGGDHDFQDAFHQVVANGTIAIADGATTSACQTEWAEILARRFAQDFAVLDDEDVRQQWWEKSLEDWMAYADQRQEIWREQPVKYRYTINLFHTVGAAAAFLGFALVSNHLTCGYKLHSVGDCVGLWFNGQHYVRHEPPIEKFDCTPSLLTTRRAFPTSEFQTFEDSILPGDLLVMATDALAEYLLVHKPWENTTDFWESWWLKSDEDFAVWAAELKAADLIKPDDYTMILIRFD